MMFRKLKVDIACTVVILPNGGEILSEGSLMIRKTLDLRALSCFNVA